MVSDGYGTVGAPASARSGTSGVGQGRYSVQGELPVIYRADRAAAGGRKDTDRADDPAILPVPLECLGMNRRTSQRYLSPGFLVTLAATAATGAGARGIGRLAGGADTAGKTGQLGDLLLKGNS